MMQRQIQGRDPGGLPLPLPNLFLDQTEARGAEKNFFETGPPTYLRVWMKIEWLSAEATFHTRAHLVKM